MAFEQMRPDTEAQSLVRVEQISPGTEHRGLDMQRENRSLGFSILQALKNHLVVEWCLSIVKPLYIYIYLYIHMYRRNIRNPVRIRFFLWKIIEKLNLISPIGGVTISSNTLAQTFWIRRSFTILWCATYWVKGGEGEMGGAMRGSDARPR